MWCSEKGGWWNNCEFLILSFPSTCLFLCLKNIRKKRVTAYFLKISTLKTVSSHCHWNSRTGRVGGVKTLGAGLTCISLYPGTWSLFAGVLFPPKVQSKTCHASSFYEPCKQISLLLFPVYLFLLLEEYISAWATPPYHRFISISLH